MKTFPLYTFLILGFVATPCRADDELDRVIAKNAESILSQLQAHDFKNVGILKFEVQRGGANGPIYLNLGRLHDAGATMLENALAYANPLDNPLGITRSASAVAVEHDPKANYRTTTARQKLFQTQYPLAWGDAKVRVDALVIGRLTIASDMKTATLTLRYFDAKNPQDGHTLNLKRNAVELTPSLLSDINQSFAISSFVSKTRGDDDALALNDPAFASVLGEGIDLEPLPNKPVDTQPIEAEAEPRIVPKRSAPAMVTPKEVAQLNDALDVRLYYDDQEVKRTDAGNFPTPQPGQSIHLTMRAKTKLGVVLLVNGINTADYDRTNRAVNDYAKWILEPGKLYTIEGFYGNGEQLDFQSLTKTQEQSGESDLGHPDYRGQIDIHIYEPTPTASLPSQLMGVPRLPVKHPMTLEELKLALRDAAKAQTASQSKSLIAPSNRGKVKVLETEPFQGRLVAKLMLRYAE